MGLDREITTIATINPRALHLHQPSAGSSDGNARKEDERSTHAPLVPDPFSSAPGTA